MQTYTIRHTVHTVLHVQLVLPQHIEEPANILQIQLQSYISLWKMIMNHETTDKMTRAVLPTMIFVAKKFQQDRALLLADDTGLP